MEKEIVGEIVFISTPSTSHDQGLLKFSSVVDEVYPHTDGQGSLGGYDGAHGSGLHRIGKQGKDRHGRSRRYWRDACKIMQAQANYDLQNHN